MATLNITELERMAEDADGFKVPIAKMPAVTHQNVTFTTSAASSAFNNRTNFVRVIADADAWLVFGASPTATTTGCRIEANVEAYFGVTPGQKVAAYDGSS